MVGAAFFPDCWVVATWERDNDRFFVWRVDRGIGGGLASVWGFNARPFYGNRGRSLL